ncbi:MAG: hypothetical protein GF331_11505 [Chitinivibrionales bacterium]|nr:hypothetical protein [Chitinivibrionales bacterium]
MARKKKKRNHQSGPKRWRFNRQQRLQAAGPFIDSYPGKCLISGYARHFHCDKLSAAVELRMLGVSINDETMERLNEARHQATRRNLKKRLKKKEAELAAMRSDPGCDDQFCYIVDYAFGLPYGTTWEDIGEDGPPWRKLEEEVYELRKKFESFPVQSMRRNTKSKNSGLRQWNEATATETPVMF